MEWGYALVDYIGDSGDIGMLNGDDFSTLYWPDTNKKPKPTRDELQLRADFHRQRLAAYEAMEGHNAAIRAQLIDIDMKKIRALGDVVINKDRTRFDALEANAALLRQQIRR